MINNLSRFSLFIAIGALYLSSTALAYSVTFENDQNLPIVYINIVSKGGSVGDPIGQGGLTHFIGEMLMRGSRSKTKETIDHLLDQMGARLDVEIRADALIFRGAVLTSQLEPYLNLVLEILTEPVFPENEIKKLKSEITSGIQEELGHDGSLASRRFTEFLFRSHPYGRPGIGKIREVANFTREQISTQYDRLLRDHMLLVIGSGNADSDLISSWSKKLAAARPDNPSSIEYSQLLEKTGIPENSEHSRLLIVDKPDRTQTQINFGQVGVRMTEPDFFALYLGNHAFGGGSFSAIMMTEIRVKRGWSYGANSGFRFGLKPRSWTGHLFPASKDTANALKLSLQLLQELKEKGISQEQFAFAQKSLVNSAGFMYNTPGKRVENKILEKTLDLPNEFMKTYASELQKLSQVEVNTALGKFLKPDRIAMSVLCTAKDLREDLIRAAGVSEKQTEIVEFTKE